MNDLLDKSMEYFGKLAEAVYKMAGEDDIEKRIKLSNNIFKILEEKQIISNDDFKNLFK